MWGVLPIYWKLVQRFSSEVVVCQRVLWTMVWLLPLLLRSRELRLVRDALCDPRLLRTHACTALLLTINWSLFIWANQHGHIVEASLGYFLNPLLNVAIGCVLLHERLSRWRAMSIALAAAGVILQVVLVGKVPWIALSLAVTFALYGFFRKKSTLGSLSGLAVENALTLPFALTTLLWLSNRGAPVMGTGSVGDWMLMCAAGACTAAPLLTFAYAARHLRFSTLGLLQFISPTGQFCVGAFLYHEPVSMGTLVSFVFIWIGVIVFCVESYLSQRPATPPVAVKE